MNGVGLTEKAFDCVVISAMTIGAALVWCALSAGAAAYGQALATSGPIAGAQATSAPALTPYVLIPVKGAIGDDFTADRMKSLVEGAQKSGISTVVLDLNTPGGSVPDAEAIVNIIIAHKDMRFVALVRRALSAGATITLACKEIYVTEGATIGAAVSFRPDASGRPANLPKDVAEKFQSAWRAVCRKAAECGGHPSIIAEAMVDPDFALTMRKEGDKVICERDGKGDTLKAQGRILTLTGREAVSCQLAKMLITDLPALEKELSLSPVASASAADAVDNPGAFYHVILQKAAQLKMADGAFAGLTEMRRDDIEKEWDAWYKEECKKFLPRAGAGETPLTLRLKLVEVGVPTTPQDIDRVKRQLATLNESYKKQAGPEYNSDGIATARGSIQWQISHYNAMLRRATYYPVMAGTSGDEKVRVFAWVKPSCADYLKRLAKGDPITVSGRLFDVTYYHIAKDAADGHLVLVPLLRPSGLGAIMELGMEDCLAGEEAIKQAAAPKPAADTSAKAPADVPSVDLEKQAQVKLNLALNYKANGANAKAAALLGSIIADYPNTTAAQRAKEELEGIESK